jgi:coenzyme F420-reducing hydrogenase alpha subunit
MSENRHLEGRKVRIRVPVLARVEGEGALDLSIEDGVLRELRLEIYEPPRFFEQFLIGNPAQDVIDRVARICGICPVAYQMSAVQALEGIYSVEPSPWAQAMRRVMYCGEWLQSHSLHIHLLAAPDFFGVNSAAELARLDAHAVRRGLRLQGLGNALIALFGGRSVHPIGVRVGGFHSAPALADVSALIERLTDAHREATELVRWVAAWSIPDDNQHFISLALRYPGEYPILRGRLVSDAGHDLSIDQFDAHMQEFQAPHSTALHALLDGKPYLVGPLARLNLNADCLPGELSALLTEVGLTLPSRNMFHSALARAIEIWLAVDEAQRILQDYVVPDSPYVEHQPCEGEGVGCTEAPRGVLWHRYTTDAKGNINTARIVPPTSQNQARIEDDLRQSLTQFGLSQADDALRLHGEKVIRNYDPCISCATHFLRLKVART